MTYNIRFDWSRDTGRRDWQVRQPLVERIILSSGAHVVGLQEVMSARDLVYLPSAQLVWASGLTGYCIVHREIRYHEPTSGHERAILYQPILYACDVLTLERPGSFALSETPWEYNSTSWGNSIPRFVTWAEFRTPDGGRFVVLNTHIDTCHGRSQSLELIGRVIERFAVPVILLGDFNMHAWNANVRRLGLVDAAPGFPGGTFTGFSRVGLWRIDLILVSPGIELSGGGVIRSRERGIAPSDHVPVYVDLCLPTSSGAR